MIDDYRPRERSTRRPMEFWYCERCTRWFHQSHRCIDWVRP